MKIQPLLQKTAGISENIFFAIFKGESVAIEPLFSQLPDHAKSRLIEFTRLEFQGEEGETKLLWLQEAKPQRIVLFGLGERLKWNERKVSLLPRRMIQYAKHEKLPGFTTSLYSQKFGTGLKETAHTFATNAFLANFEFNRYKEPPKNGWPEMHTIYLAADKDDFSEIKKGIDEGTIVGEEANQCRELANTPGGDMTPEKLADTARIVGKRTGIRVLILGEKEMKNLGMGGILGVAKGSEEKPQLIILEYRQESPSQKQTPKRQDSPNKIGRPLVLIGKGVTFDTGGLNLKPEHAIYEMHMDMSGGAAVIHGMAAIARLKLPLPVVGIIPAVENMPSGSSYRPGDILKSMSGKTIEVINTDAEGRIILADALYYGATKYTPGLMVDFATLTGAAHVALGSYCSALFTNRNELENKLAEIGKISGDYVWQLPLWDEYFAEIQGTFGDIANANIKKDRYGGAITGAKFLEQFVGDTHWAHIDIAPKMTTLESEYLAKGASGVGVRYIVELAKQYRNLLETV